ncbi:MAG: multidrug efflux SMR transporter [Fimbriimonadales bacterium]|nr:multidrug efflux SMR transporter [Fimbriimonadales bacterium]MDW8052397.1 multidrug efflux SMR transporter [Armatimonadota bacterium]
MAWVYLVIAGLMEIVWATALKLSEGFTRLLPTVIALATAWASFWFLSLSARSIPIGTAYAVWVGIGAVGVALVGMVWFKESRDFWRLFFIGLIIVGVVGLKLVSRDAG